MLEVWCTSFSKMVKTPVGVGWPGRPVLTLERAIRTPLRYTYATCSVTLATISKGPSGARSGSHTYSPVFNVTVSGDTRTPSVKVSAKTSGRPRTSRPAVMTINNKGFIVVNPNYLILIDDSDQPGPSQCLFEVMHAFTRTPEERGSAPRRHRLATRHLERALAPLRGCGKRETPNRPILGAV